MIKKKKKLSNHFLFIFLKLEYLKNINKKNYTKNFKLLWLKSWEIIGIYKKHIDYIFNFNIFKKNILKFQFYKHKFFCIKTLSIKFKKSNTEILNKYGSELKINIFIYFSFKNLFLFLPSYFQQIKNIFIKFNIFLL